MSPKCRRQWRIEERLVNETRARNHGRVICMYCSRQSKYVGRGNPNAKYLELDDGFLETIDTEAKAYLLGWIASDGSVTRNTLTMYVHRRDEHTLKKLRDSVCAALPIATKKGAPLVGFRINSQRLVGDVSRWLQITPGKKSGIVGMPSLATRELTWAFVRGVFDGDGCISSVAAATTRARGGRGWPSPRCEIKSNSKRLLDAIREFVAIPAYQSRSSLSWSGTNALDLLDKIYGGASFYLQRKRDLFLDWCNWSPASNRSNAHPLFKWTRVLRTAVAPQKEFASDSGFDLTLIDRLKSHGAVEFFRTGIRVQPAFGWYFDVVPRSSISKTGYMLANGIGVIDRSYVGEIIVPLIKVDPNAADLQLPARLVQMIPRTVIAAELVEVDELDPTARGAGGFGSTNR